MNVFIWILQGLLAAHTLMGAIWKLGNSEQSVPSLSALPHSAWLGLAGVEILCVAGLLAPLLVKNPPWLAWAAAGVLGVEMLGFCALHLASSSGERGQLIYWAVVAAWAGIVAFMRFQPSA